MRTLFFSYFFDEGKLVDKDDEDVLQVLDVDKDIGFNKFEASAYDLQLDHKLLG